MNNRTLVDLDGDTVLVSYDSFCGGTLIDISTGYILKKF